MNARLKRNIKIFGKSQVNAGIATGMDFVVLIFFKEILSFWYLLAVALGSIAGGFTNYILNRKWAFRSNGQVSGESIRYLIVSGASLFWNCLLVWFMTDYMGFQYLVSKIMVAVFIALFWNFPMHKKWVFVSKKLPSLQEERSI